MTDQTTKIKACPRCGTPAKYTCHHEGIDVRSVEMTVEEALEMQLGEWFYFKSQLNDLEESMESLMDDLSPENRKKFNEQRLHVTLAHQ